MTIKTIWKRARWALVALGYVIAWPFWRLWRAIKRKRGGGDE